MLPTLASEGVKVFKVVRGIDESNVSGAGFVGYGIISHSGHTIFFWRSDVSLMSKVKAASVCYFNCFDDFMKIHVTSHTNSNNTEIVWIDFKE